MAKNLRFAYFGTPAFSVQVLEALKARGLLPALVVTAPDKPRGRGLEVSPSPIKQWANEHEIDVWQPATLRENPLDELQNTDWDVFIVAAYAKLLPQSVLTLPQKGCLNVHPSLLPKFRGASPVISAILKDERETGVTIMQMEEKMDAGPILAQARIEIAPEDWPLPSKMLTEMLFVEGGNLLGEILPDYMAGKITTETQDEKEATFTKKFTTEDALIDLTGEPREQLLKIRAFDENPRAHFFATDKKGKEMRVIVTDATLQDGPLTFLRVIPEGKKEMDYTEFLRMTKK